MISTSDSITSRLNNQRHGIEAKKKREITHSLLTCITSWVFTSTDGAIDEEDKNPLKGPSPPLSSFSELGNPPELDMMLDL